jgi:hypothetical protein
MKKEIILNDDGTAVTICLSLKKRIMARDPRMTITTLMAKTMLENANFKLDKCVEYDTINNHNSNSKHDGKWIFSLISEKKPKTIKKEASSTHDMATKILEEPQKFVQKKRSRKKKES